MMQKRSIRHLEPASSIGISQKPTHAVPVRYTCGKARSAYRSPQGVPKRAVRTVE
jgi:hypothetical protein